MRGIPLESINVSKCFSLVNAMQSKCIIVRCLIERPNDRCMVPLDTQQSFTIDDKWKEEIHILYNQVSSVVIRSTSLFFPYDRFLR